MHSSISHRQPFLGPKYANVYQLGITAKPALHAMVATCCCTALHQWPFARPAHCCQLMLDLSLGQTAACTTV
jgi:hypothetical protein